MNSLLNGQIIKRELNLGKVDYLGHGRRDCAVTIEIEIRDKDGKGLELSIVGNIWNHIRSDCYSCGQNQDDIRALFPHSKRVQRLCDIWDRWHLNGMRAGCEHQREWGWTYNEHPSEPCPECGYKMGTAWLHEKLPAEIIQEISDL